ncbi:MAG: hypothetical protein R2712_00175 [Vicinamibacterales bacterium]
MLEVFSAGRSFDAVYTKRSGPARELSLAAAASDLFASFYRSRIDCMESSVSLRCSEVTTIPVRLTNMAPHATWRSDSQIPVFCSYHLYNRDGSVLSFDNVRTPLPAPVAPGGSIVIPLVVSMPDTADTYRVQVDLVHEGITWFADRGGESGTLDAVVG